MNTKTAVCKSAQGVITKEHLIEDFKKIGLQEGDHVAVTLSLKRIGYIKGGPNEFIDALLEVVGPEGSVMMNTFTDFFMLSSVSSSYVFDYASTASNTGLVPNVFQKRKDAIRSKHPVFSVAVIGKMAEYLTEGHNETSEHFLPFSKLAKINGKYLSIGIGGRLVAIRHEAQHRAGLSDVVPFYLAVNYRTDQDTVNLFVMNHPGCTKNLHTLVPDLKKLNVITSGKVGNAQSYVASAQELIDAMTLLLKENPSRTLCNQLGCMWCRELERRMMIFNKIENPQFFQKSNSIIKLIAIVNRFRLKKVNLLLFQQRQNAVADEQSQGLLRSLLGFLRFISLVIRGRLHSFL